MTAPSPIGEIKATTAAESLTLRGSVRSTIWGGAVALPEMYDTVGGVEGEWATVLGRTPYYAEWDYWKWSAGGVSGALGMACRTAGAFFSGASRLAIVHAGHNQGLLPPHSCPPDFDALLKALAAANCDLLMLCMPWMGNNQGFHNYSDPSIGGMDAGEYHWTIGTGSVQGAGLTGSRLRYFVDPVIAGMERAIAVRAAIGGPATYERIAMIGHSGGGWTTTLAAAIEPRITHSYAIAGSVPFAHREFINGNLEGIGDWEQWEGIQELGLDYYDLYLMAAAETTRKARLMHNEFDTCFKAPQVKEFAVPLKLMAKAGGYGDFQVFIDRGVQGHFISDAHRNLIAAEFC